MAFLRDATPRTQRLFNTVGFDTGLETYHPRGTARRTPTAQIRRGLVSQVVGVVGAEIFALPRPHAPPGSYSRVLNARPGSS